MRLLKNLARRKFIVLLLATALTTLSSCSENDDEPKFDPDITMEEIENRVTSGTWRITLYNDSGVNETGDYQDFTFTFNPDGSLIADDGVNTYTGDWSVTRENNSSDDDPNPDDPYDVDFNIAFASPSVLLELTDDWDVESYTNTRLQLYDVSGGDGSTDLLTFEKN